MPERDPSITPRCLACGSDAIVPDVLLYAPNAGSSTTHAGLYTRPKARLNKRIVSTTATHRACSDCGFLMLFADEPRVLWDGHVDRLAHDLDD